MTTQEMPRSAADAAAQIISAGVPSTRGAALLTTPVVAVRDLRGYERGLTGAWFTLRALTAPDVYSTPLGVCDYDEMLANAGYEQREWLVEEHPQKNPASNNEQVARFCGTVDT